MSAGQNYRGMSDLARLSHHTERGTPVRSRLTQFLYDLAFALWVVFMAALGVASIVVPPIYYLFF